jgi:hypothetical protein
VVVSVGEILLSCWRFRFGPSLVEISVFRLVSTGSFDWWCSRTFWVTILLQSLRDGPLFNRCIIIIKYEEIRFKDRRYDTFGLLSK